MQRFLLIVSLYLINTFFSLCFAESLCIITSDTKQLKNHLIQKLTFAHESLLCASTAEQKQQLMALAKTHQLNSIEGSNLQIVRGNTLELQDQVILYSAHGYSIIDSEINCDTSHCQHIDTIALSDFKGIKTASFNTEHLRQTDTGTIVDQVDTDLWLSDVVTLSNWSRRTGENGNNSAAAWIEGKMANLNLLTSTPEFSVFGQSTQNIIGVKAGSLRSDDWYIVGAHMDSVPSGNAPGALDNGSGCAGVLELARITEPFTFEGTLIFICYSGEEQGLIGSELHADQLILDGDQNKVKAVLTMDMIGYTSNSQHELLVESSSDYQWLMDTLSLNASIYAPNLTVYTSTNYFGSDHVSYINNNMPGVLSIDDDWGVYPHYHQSSDLPENLNKTQAEYILKTNLATLVELTGINKDSDLIFFNGFE